MTIGRSAMPLPKVFPAAGSINRQKRNVALTIRRATTRKMFARERITTATIGRPVKAMNNLFRQGAIGSRAWAAQQDLPAHRARP